jgi:hypothetical protein
MLARMLDLVPCADCGRHVLCSERNCPFCSAALIAVDRSVTVKSSGRLARAALFAGAAVLVPACGGSQPQVRTGDGQDQQTTDTTQQQTQDQQTQDNQVRRDQYDVVAQPYGAPPRRDRIV